MQQRHRALNNHPIQGQCVLYVMSRDQRVQDNFGLLKAQQIAQEHKLPLAVVFSLQPHTGQRAREHYQWMLTGLAELENQLAKLNIPFMLLLGPAFQRLKGLLHHTQPAAIIFDFSPLRGPLALHRAVAKLSKGAVYEVDSHNIVPAWLASEKQDFSARTIRPKIHRLLATFLQSSPAITRHPYRWPGVIKTLEELQPLITAHLAAIPTNSQKISLPSGESAAHKQLQDFITHRLSGYQDLRNDPTKDGQSNLSPYIHFGQLWAGHVVLQAIHATKTAAVKRDTDALIEELVVRKELSDNFCLYNKQYDTLQGAPEWAQQSLQKHHNDPRDFNYSLQQFEQAQTHDPAWNAAQKQLVRSGKIHGYMRMYWAKKVLEWSDTPENAHKMLLYLNDFYSIDGGDPNGYVGILWSIAGLHDRPWFERSVYGTIRYMNYNELQRKFKIAAYEQQWS